MADMSILEFGVYALVCYTGIIMLIISSFKETPMTVSQSAVRVIWLIPSMLCAFVLANAGVDIYLSTETLADQVLDSNNAPVTLTDVTTDKITLLNPIWVTMHFLFFIVILLYVVMQILTLFMKRD
jgi:hypothetical protein|tara:strand:- start:5252 stop:5629 length:378 start_codon:yes stop_codon:yes gene_type:complete